MTNEFKTKTDEMHNITDRLEKHRKTKEIKKWYEEKDAELFQKHHWASCWLTGQLVQDEFKTNAIMKQQFKTYCPKMAAAQKRNLARASWGNATESQIPEWSRDVKDKLMNRTREARHSITRRVKHAKEGIQQVAQHTIDVARDVKQ